MVKTQVQLPDKLYARAKAFAAQREMSLAEVVRRGTELMLDMHPGESAPASTAWEPPRSRDCGWNGLSPEQLREAAWNDTEPRLPETDASA